MLGEWPDLSISLGYFSSHFYSSRIFYDNLGYFAIISTNRQTANTIEALNDTNKLPAKLTLSSGYL